VIAAELAERVRAISPDVVIARDEVTAYAEPEKLLGTLAALRDDAELSFDALSSLNVVDWPDRVPRFWVAYELYSMAHRHRLRVKVGLPAEDPRVVSVTPMFPTANWHEREAWDFFGVVFEGHPDLVRILLPDDWEGFPLRKTEELGGIDTRYQGAFIPPVDRRTTSAARGRAPAQTQIRCRTPRSVRRRWSSTWGRSTPPRTACSDCCSSSTARRW
jgi:NADH-quinone oxidoreductase subunit C